MNQGGKPDILLYEISDRIGFVRHFRGSGCMDYVVNLRFRDLETKRHRDREIRL